MLRNSSAAEKPVEELEEPITPADHETCEVTWVSWPRMKPWPSWGRRVTVYHAWKRALDVVIALSASLLLSPVAIAVSLLVKLHDGGPVLHWQTRVGRRGRHFAFPKFRSMVMGAEAMRDGLADQNESGGVIFKMRKDPRVTPVGRILRRYSIDELPQLWCVLRGDMTIVGPRPPLACEVKRYSARDWGRLDVVPGLTCLWQVSGRSELSFRQQVSLDLEYIRKRGAFTDMKIMAATIPAVLTGRGAY